MIPFPQLVLEAYRLQLLRGLEAIAWSAGFAAVAGVDEAGRGALAGPVVAGAVIPGSSCVLPGVDDSKALDAATRSLLAGHIRRTVVAWAVAAVEPATIDRINILEASRLAMHLALARLTPSPDLVIADAMALPDAGCRCLSVIRGDQISYAVSCASILAKVERDLVMAELDRAYPAYGFAGHKGYAAPEHLRALAEYGPSPVHRLTFRRVLPRRDDAPAAGAEPAGVVG